MNVIGIALKIAFGDVGDERRDKVFWNALMATLGVGTGIVILTLVIVPAVLYLIRKIEEA